MNKISLFIKAMGNSPVIKVLDFLIENRTFDYSKSDIARETGISRITLDSFWENFIKLRIVKKTRTIGRATLYTLNKESESAKKMIELDLALSVAYSNMQEEKQEQVDIA